MICLTQLRRHSDYQADETHKGSSPVLVDPNSSLLSLGAHDFFGFSGKLMSAVENESGLPGLEIRTSAASVSERSWDACSWLQERALRPFERPRAFDLLWYPPHMDFGRLGVEVAA